MSYIFNKFSILTLCLVIGYALGDGLTLCGSYADRTTLEESRWVTAPAEEGLTAVKTVRLPEKGIYNSDISCLSIADIQEDNYNVPEIIGGGIGERFAEVRLSSSIGKPLEYLVYVYSNNITTTTIIMPTWTSDTL